MTDQPEGWAETLDAVSRTGGTPLASEFAEATTLAELGPDVVEQLTPTRMTTNHA